MEFLSARVTLCVGALVLAGCASDGRFPSPAQQALAPDCKAIGQLLYPGTLIRSATSVAAGEATAGGVAMPAHCLVTGEIDPRAGVDNVHYGINFQLRLPLQWNGRFHFQGGGGVDGIVPAAYGTLHAGVTPALAQGAAVVSSDMGHTGTSLRDARFGVDPQARLDWGYHSIDKVTVLAKNIIGRFYGKAPDYAYYVGCSGGGRQGMMASQRFPQHFDGVVSGAPILESHLAHVQNIAILQAYQAIAPRGPDGRPVLSRAFSVGDQQLVARAVLQRCDALDGVADGIIENYPACRFDPAVLQCTGAKNDSCLSTAQVGALGRAMSDTRDSAGRLLYPKPYWDTNIGGATWRNNMIGTSTTAEPNTAKYTNQSIRYVFMTPPVPDFNYFDFDLDVHPATMMVSDFHATNGTNYAGFKARGGKTILYQGMGDSLVSAAGVLRWYRNLVDANGGLDATRGFARLFTVPGMEHCTGGAALDSFDPVTALQDWVEKGRAPEQLLATGTGFPGRSRNLCMFPQVARYLGSGSVDDPRSFRCENP